MSSSTQTTVTITTTRAERQHSGVASAWEVRVRGKMGAHRNPNMWLLRGTHTSLEAATTAAETAAHEAGAIEVEIIEINEPGPYQMPVIMDASQDYGAVPATLQTSRVITVDAAN